MNLFITHPSLAERIRRLEEMTDEKEGSSVSQAPRVSSNPGIASAQHDREVLNGISTKQLVLDRRDCFLRMDARLGNGLRRTWTPRGS
jgi:hypothetical protein